MANTYKVLGQADPSAATMTTLFTAGAATIVSTVVVCNRSATATTFRLSVDKAGDGDANADFLAYDCEILGNESYTWTIGATLETGAKMRCYATLATLSFNAFGQEVT